MTNVPPDRPAEAPAPPDHDLTPMESFFDTLFNQHMVLPQPEAGADDPEPVSDDHGTDAA